MSRIERIRNRLDSTAPIETPGTWYHEDIPYLLRELDNAKCHVITVKTDRMNKLKQYEKIGEPSELRKVTFCRDCVHGGRLQSPGKVLCAIDDIRHNLDDYCNQGEPREERENEL